MFNGGFCVKVTCVIVYYNAYDKKENCQNFIQFFKIEKWRYLPHSWSFNSHISIFLYDLYSLYLSLSALYLSKSLDTSLHLSIYFCISLYHSISLCISLYFYLYRYLHSFLFISLCIHLKSLFVSIYISLSLYIFLCIYL